MNFRRFYQLPLLKYNVNMELFILKLFLICSISYVLLSFDLNIKRQSGNSELRLCSGNAPVFFKQKNSKHD